MVKFNWIPRVTAAFLFMAATAVALHAQAFKTLVNFDGTNGDSPQFVSLVQGTDGNLYGTTGAGGAEDDGTVFRVTPSGTLTVIYSFCTQANCTDGSGPYAGLTLGSDGNFYGTTENGGTSEKCLARCGTVFKVTPQGDLTTLHSFDLADGACPSAQLIQATNGQFYGVTSFGGARKRGAGTIFQISPEGALITLHRFANPAGGQTPIGSLLQASDGNFYGTTADGGAKGSGTVFRMEASGAFTTLYNFCSVSGCPDGQDPSAALIQGTDGNLYGTTFAGGLPLDCGGACGTVFRITLQGAFATLHTFDGSDGSNPAGPVIQATDGNFYGTTLQQGPNGGGTMFEITPGGAVTVLESFSLVEGEYPVGGLLQSTNGNLYGTTSFGGVFERGTVFGLSLGLIPFVQPRPSSGVVGGKVAILGTNLTGASSVTFNGVAAAFTVVSQALITTTVPAGAASGRVQVVTPGRTLTSNVAFRVEP